ncbi:hypothetical protein D1872_346550 [compost metagenome]
MIVFLYKRLTKRDELMQGRKDLRINDLLLMYDSNNIFIAASIAHDEAINNEASHICNGFNGQMQTTFLH